MKSNRQALAGLLIRRECWTFSERGRFLVFLTIVGLAIALIEGLYPFLAITNKTSCSIMVVEGWIHSDSIEQAAHEYKSGQYQQIVVVAAVYDVDNKWDSGRYKPEYIARSFATLGISTDNVQIVFCEVVNKDRTYHSAVAVKKWLQEKGISVNAIDVVTIGSHARRSRLLFQRAFGKDMKVGVIAMDEKGYDPDRWWRSSDGMREVLFEGFAYLYAKFLFWPA